MRGFQVLCVVASLAAVCFARIAPAIDAGEIVNPGLVAKPQTVEININELLAEEALKYPGAIASPKARSEGCKIGMNNGDLSTKQPLILEPGTGRIAIPSKSGELSVKSDDKLDMYCTSKFASPLSGSKISAKCVGGDIFEVDGKHHSIRDIVCISDVKYTARKTSASCHDGAVIIEIGFEVEGRFIPFIEVCHNMEKEVSHYSHYSLYQSSVAYQKSVARVSFTPGSFYDGRDVNKLYTQNVQMETIGKILGGDYEKYFDIKKNVFLARGHLAAKADFIYGPEQLATFTFINVAPQWQVFNGGNWERVESGVKSFAADHDMELDIYTGTWGIMSLPDKEGKQKDLYLAFNSEGEGLIPVPKLYYRVVIDKASKLGVVLIGVNNPHATLEEIKKDYILCDDISDKINWIPWDKHNIKAGYSYACEVEEFARKIGQLPSLSVRGLLY